MRVATSVSYPLLIRRWPTLAPDRTRSCAAL